MVRADGCLFRIASRILAGMLADDLKPREKAEASEFRHPSSTQSIASGLFWEGMGGFPLP